MKFFSRDASLNNELFDCIQRGSVLIFPTETIYGIGCSALQDDIKDNSIRRVFQIKGRAPDHPPPVLIGNEKQLNQLVAYIPSSARALMNAYWPGALTIVLPARDEISSLICGVNDDGSTRTIAVRLTGHGVARVLCERGAPLVATSANFSGATGRAAMPSALDDIPNELKAQADVVIDGGEVGGLPSTIVDCTVDRPRVLRAGAVRLKVEP